MLARLDDAHIIRQSNELLRRTAPGEHQLRVDVYKRQKKQSDKNGLWSALEIGTIWLEKSLLDAKKEEKK